MALRSLAILFFASAVLMFLGESLSSFQGTGAFRMRTFGEWWYAFSPGGLNGAQAFVQRYLWPGLWDPFAISVLRLPGVPSMAGIGAVLLGAAVVGRR